MDRTELADSRVVSDKLGMCSQERKVPRPINHNAFAQNVNELRLVSIIQNVNEWERDLDFGFQVVNFDLDFSSSQ